MDISAYRGKKGLLHKVLGDEGLVALHEKSLGSPTLASEFLGYGGVPGSLKRHWARLGLENRLAGSRLNVDPLLARERLKTTSDVREMYLNVTMAADEAPMYEWEVGRDTEWAQLLFTGDWQYGSPEMDYRRFLALVGWIAEHPDVRWIGMGDYWNLVTSQSPGLTYREALTYDQATDLLREDIAPIMGQCIMLHRGNHDERIMKGLQIEFDPVKRWAEECGVLYGGYSGFVNIVVGDGRKKTTQHYTGFQHHGFGGGATLGAVLNAMERLATQNEADWVAMGHRHQRLAVESSKSRVVGDRVEVVGIPLICTGSFERHLKEGYASKKGLRPSVLGAATAQLYLDRHSVHGRT